MKKSILLLINSILGSLYFIILTILLSGIKAPIGSSSALAATITQLIVAPHVFLVLLAVIFGWLGFFMNKTGFALTSAILYCVAAGAFTPSVPYQTPLIIIGFIAYNNIKKNHNQ
jgi:hypothetical protein